MIKIAPISKIHTLKIPLQSKPLIQPIMLQKELPVRIYTGPSLLSKIKELINTKKEAKTNITYDTTPTYTPTTYSKTISSTTSSSKEKEELNKLRTEYKDLCGQLRTLFGISAAEQYVKASNLSLAELTDLISKTKEKIAHEKLMVTLEKQFTHGSDFYMPKDKVVYKPEDLLPVIPDEKAPYKQELKRLCTNYIKNSKKIDASITCFKIVVKNFSDEAAKSIKEIFDLQNDPTLKILERIPKLGIIPKALRVSDQIRLANCVLKDHKEVTDVVIAKGMDKLMKEYRQQYKTIRDYIQSYKKSFRYKTYTKSFVEKVDEARVQRLETDKKMLEIFASTGMNISNICKSVKKRGIIDIARKTAVTLFSLF